MGLGWTRDPLGQERLVYEMAYRRSASRRRASARSYSSRRARAYVARPARRGTTRRAARGGAQTLRIVVQQQPSVAAPGEAFVPAGLRPGKMAEVKGPDGKSRF